VLSGSGINLTAHSIVSFCCPITEKLSFNKKNSPHFPQEDEATLTIVGGVMGALVGFFQSGGGGKRKNTAGNKEQQPKGGAASLSSSLATRHPLPSHADDAGEYDGYAL
jgi:hypothetical protein